MTSKNTKSDFGKLERKLFFRLVLRLLLILLGLLLFYLFLWRGNGGNLVVSFIQRAFALNYETAFSLYHHGLRSNAFWIALIVIVLSFLLLYRRACAWFAAYLRDIEGGVDQLADSRAEIHLPAEIAVIEQKMRMVQQDIEKREMEAQLAEQRKNDLVTYLAHDIRTPLTSVIGYLSLLDEAPDMPDPQKAKYTRITLDKSKRLEALVDEFFEITRYNLQSISIHKEPIDLYHMLIQMKEEFYPVMAEKNIALDVHAEEDLKAFADPMKLARVLNNLLKNAIAHGDPGSPIVIDAEAEGAYTKISVRNQGPTIPAEKLNDIFQKFFRLDESRTTQTGGAGLGLAIAKEIVNLHGGSLSAESADGVTVFTLLLPAA